MPGFRHSPLDDIQRIRQDLRDRYQDGFPILKELLQNADDAGASEPNGAASQLVLVLAKDGLTAAEHPLLTNAGLVVLNDGAFTANDAISITSLGMSNKAGQVGAAGKFGLGLKSIFHWAEAFFYFSPHTFPKAGANRADPYGLLNPWWNRESSDGRHREWEDAWERWRDADLQAFAQLAPRTLEGRRWFGLYIPLRRSEHLWDGEQEIKPIEQRFPAAQFDELLGDDWERRLAETMPLLRRLRTVRLLQLNGDALVERATYSISNGAQRLRFGTNGAIEGNAFRQPVSGVILAANPQGARCTFVGIEDLGDGAWVPQLKHHPSWPSQTGIGLDGGDVQVPEKGEPHAAVVFARQPGYRGGTLRLQPAVFLPLGEPEETSLRGDWRYCLYLHGFFFVDSGRRHVQSFEDLPAGLAVHQAATELQVIKLWNRTLMREVVAPLILPSLHAFVQQAELPSGEVGQLVRALSNAGMLGPLLPWMCRGQRFLFRLQAAGGGWEHETWDAQAGKPGCWIAVPRPGFAEGELFDLLPALSALCCRAIVSIHDTPYLADGKPELVGKSDSEVTILLASVPEMAFANAKYLDYLLKLIPDDAAEREPRSELVQAVVRLVNRALGRRLPEDRDLAHCWKGLFKRLPSRAFVRLPIKSSEADQGIKGQLCDSAFQVALLWHDCQEGGGSGVVRWADLLPVLRGIGQLTLKSEAAVNQRSWVTVRLLEACMDPPEAWPDDVAQLSMFVSRSGGPRTAEISFADIRQADYDGRLFTGGDTWAVDLVKAAPDANPVLIEASIAKVLRLKTAACDAAACAALLKAAGRVVPDFASRKPLFEKFLLSAAPQDRASWAAMRCLLHGQFDEWESRRPLFREPHRHDAFVKLAKLTLDAATESWRLIPDHAASQLRLDDSQKEGLNLVEVSAETIEALVQEIGPDKVDCATLSAEEADAILLQFKDVDMLRGLKIHETLDERRVGIDPHTYVDDGSFTELPAAFNAVVTRIKHRAAYGRAEFLNPDGANRVVKNLTWEAVVEVGLDQPNPEACWEPILTAIGRLGSLRSELRDRVRHIAWLPLAEGGSIKPAYLLHLPGAEAQLDRLPPEMLGGKAPTLRLAADVRSHPRFATFLGAVLLPAKETLEALANLLQPHSAWSTGLIGEWPAELVAEWLSALGDAPEQVLPLATLANALHAKSELRNLLSGFLESVGGRIGEAAYAAVLRHLASKHQQADQELQQTIDAVFRRYLRAIDAAGAHFARRVLAIDGVVLPNAAGEWIPAGTLAPATAGLGDHCMLAPPWAATLPNLIAPPAESTGQGADLGYAHDPGTWDAMAAELRALLELWRQFLPAPEPIGALLCLLSAPEPVGRLAHEFFQTHTPNTVSQWFAQNCPGLLDRLRIALQRPVPLFLIVRERTVRMRSILGTDLLVERKLIPDRLILGCDPSLEVGSAMISNHVLQPGRRRRVLRFLPLDPDAAGLSVPQAVRVLQEAAEQIIKGFINESADLSALFHNLSETSQIEVQVAQSLVVESALGLLRQIGGHAHAQIRLALEQWDQAHRAEASAERLGLDFQLRQADEQRRTAKSTIRRLLESDSEAHRALLGEVRRKLAQYQYDASSVPFELWQNADDAACELAKLGDQPTTGARNAFLVMARAERLDVLHFGRLINQYRLPGGTSREDLGFSRDLEKMVVQSISDKAEVGSQSGGALTGKFGLGFKSVFLVSDAPEVISGSVDFVIRGGIYPVRLDPQQREALVTALHRFAPDHWRRGTIISLPTRASGGPAPEEMLRQFHRLAPLLVVFSRNLKSLICRWEGEGEGETESRWLPERVADGVDVGALPGLDGQVSHALVFQAATGSDRLQFLLGLNPDGFVDLPKDVPAFWVTAPTRATPDYGFAVNGPFEPDVGRIQLAHNSSRNQQLADEVGCFLTARLETLCQLGHQDWPALREALQLASGTTALAFWESLWEVLGTRFAKKCPKSDLNPVDRLARRILWHSAISGLPRFYSRTNSLPTGLWGDHQTLTRLADIRFEAAGALDREGVFCAVAQWPTFRARVTAAQMVSGVRVAIVLRSLDALGEELAPIHLVTTIEWELTQGHDLRADQETASRLGRLVTPEFLKTLKEGGPSQREEREHKALSDLLPNVLVQSAEGSWHKSSELVVAEGEGVDIDEKMRAAFAPAGSRLHPAYVGSALEFFLACRPELSSGAEAMVGWVLQASDTRSRIASLRYLLAGKLKERLAEEFRSRRNEDNWLWQVAQGPEDFAWFKPTFSEEELHQLRSYVLRLFDEELRGRSQPPQPPPQQPPPLPTWTVRQLWLWWEGQGEPMGDYVLEGESNWPLFHGGPIPEEDQRRAELKRLLQAPSSMEGKSVWYRLFGYACLVSAGRTVTELRRFWLERLEPSGFWTRTTAGDFSEVTREIFEQAVTAEFTNRNAGGEQAYYWRRCFYDIRKVHRMVQNEFPSVLLDLVQQGHGEYLREFLRTGDLPGPDQRRWIGTFGQSADTPLRFIIRELYRLRVITDEGVLPHAFCVCRPVLRALVKIGWIDDADDGFTGAEWLRRLEADPDCGPKLQACFDIPLLHMGITHRGDAMPTPPNEP